MLSAPIDTDALCCDCISAMYASWSAKIRGLTISPTVQSLALCWRHLVTCIIPALVGCYYILTCLADCFRIAPDWSNNAFVFTRSNELIKQYSFIKACQNAGQNNLQKYNVVLFPVQIVCAKLAKTETSPDKSQCMNNNFVCVFIEHVCDKITVWQVSRMFR